MNFTFFFKDLKKKTLQNPKFGKILQKISRICVCVCALLKK